MAEIIKVSVVDGVKKINAGEKYDSFPVAPISVTSRNNENFIQDEFVTKGPENENLTNEMLSKLSEFNALLELELKNKRLECENLRERCDFLESEIIEAKKKNARDGFEKGYGDGVLQGKLEYEKKINALLNLMNVFETRLTDDLSLLQNDSILLAYEALILIVGQNYKTSDFIRATIETALSKLTTSRRLKVRLNPEDYDLLIELENKGLMELPIKGKFELARDEKIGVGGCILETESGIWDARIDSQLERIRESLLSVEQDLN